MELTHYDFEYTTSDWRAIPAEIWQTTEAVLTEYDSQDDGTLNSVTETLSTWCSAPSTKEAGGWLYADGNYYKDAAEKFQDKTRVVTSYAQISPTSYSVTKVTTDLLTNKVTTEPVAYADGKIPKAPRKNTAYSRVYSQPVDYTLVDECVDAHFLDSFGKIDLTGAENDDQARGMMAWRMQLETALHRALTRPWNRLVRYGDTIRIIAPSRGIDANHLLWSENGSGDEASYPCDYELLYFTR